MIHLILVSHSHELAAGIKQLAAQMSAAPENIHLAAGIDDEENPIGTDAIKIMTAIEAADNPDGILILVDLGSALLSAETALELVDREIIQRCKISSAPLVEGTIAAAIMAGTGADLATVAQAAESALQGKQTALQGEKAEPAAVVEHFDVKTSVVLANPHGLHARPAALLVGKMSAFASQIWLEKGGQCADGKNINQILALHSRAGDQITFYATGEDAEKAKMVFQQLVAEHFGEYLPPDIGHTVVTAQVCRLEKIKAAVFRPNASQKREKGLHINQLQQAIDSHKHDLTQFAEEANAWLGEEYGAIFDAQRMLLEEMTEEALQFVQQQEDMADGWQQYCASQADILAKGDNPYFKARAADIWDLENAVLHQLNHDLIGLEIPVRPCIYVADDIFPSQVWRLSKCMEEANASRWWRLGEYCKAVVLAHGNPYSHAAILLQALNIPLFFSAGEAVLTLTTDEVITLDLQTGTLLRG